MNADGRSVGIKLGQSTCHLPGWALEHASALLLLIETVSQRSPFRRMHTPLGNPLRVEMTSCGDLGWVGDTRGYRYERLDPATGVAWPPMPALFRDLATQAAAEAGFEGFAPDTCLINRYSPGDALALHQDRDERDPRHPVVSLSLGMAATFLWGGLRRNDRVDMIRLVHGDAFVWGGVDRLRFHGILPLPSLPHPVVGPHRLNLTFRRAA